MIKLELTVEETNICIASLRKQPHEVVDSLLKKIIDQATPQVEEAATDGSKKED